MEKIIENRVEETTIKTTKKRSKLVEKLITIAITVITVFACAVFNPAGVDTAVDFFDLPSVSADPSTNANSTNSSMTSGDANGAFKSLMNTFVEWIKKAGFIVAFVGGIMFAFAIKNNDAEQKQAGLLTMIAGFCVVALCGVSGQFIS